jgi:hypothetical protein
MQTCPSCGDLVPTEYVLCVWCGFDLTAEQIRRAGITIDNRDAVFRMRRVILSPRNAFREISILPDLRGGKLVLYAIAVMMTLNMIIVLRKIEDLTYNDPELILLRYRAIEINIRFVLNLIYLLLQPLVLYVVFLTIWKWSARILSALSKSFGGRGDREKIRAIIGYSMVPVLLAWTLSWFLHLLSPRVTAGSASYESIEAAVLAVSEQGLGVISMIFMWIAWLWATALGIIGMKNVGRLSWIESTFVAGIPYAIFITIAL